MSSSKIEVMYKTHKNLKKTWNHESSKLKDVKKNLTLEEQKETSRTQVHYLP